MSAKRTQSIMTFNIPEPSEMTIPGELIALDTKFAVTYAGVQELLYGACTLRYVNTNTCRIRHVHSERVFVVHKKFLIRKGSLVFVKNNVQKRVEDEDQYMYVPSMGYISGKFGIVTQVRHSYGENQNLFPTIVVISKSNNNSASDNTVDWCVRSDDVILVESKW